MKSVIQRVSSASVTVGERTVGRIAAGALVLLGVERGDSEDDALVTARKISGLRMFPGETPFDHDLLQVGGSVLLVSQFTIPGDLRKGRRPSFSAAELPERAEQLYLEVAKALRALGIPTETGEFGAMMQVQLVNEGPVTLLLSVKQGQVQ